MLVQITHGKSPLGLDVVPFSCHVFDIFGASLSCCYALPPRRCSWHKASSCLAWWFWCLDIAKTSPPCGKKHGQFFMSSKGYTWNLSMLWHIQLIWLKNPEKPFRLVWGSPFWRWSSFVRYTSVARRCEANFIRSSRHISMFQVVSWGEPTGCLPHHRILRSASSDISMCYFFAAFSADSRCSDMWWRDAARHSQIVGNLIFDGQFQLYRIKKSYMQM